MDLAKLAMRVLMLENHVNALREKVRAKSIAHYNNSYRCLECQGRWHSGEPENHVGICLASREGLE